MLRFDCINFCIIKTVNGITTTFQLDGSKIEAKTETESFSHISMTKTAAFSALLTAAKITISARTSAAMFSQF